MADAPSAGLPARRVALAALARIEDDGAYANLVLPTLLDRSDLAPRDRALVTELVYGTTRMRRACDWLVDRFVTHEPDPPVRRALRLGAYQLTFTSIPPHAAVATTVGLVPRRVRGFVNAVLRRVAAAGVPGEGEWPDDATRLSYPDWIVAWARDELGPEVGPVTLAHLNRAPVVTGRPDGYTQDLASQWVAELVGAGEGERVVDLCAGPGGKATALAHTGAHVAALDVSPARSGLVVSNRDTLGLAPDRLSVVVGDGSRPPFRDGCADRVLVDAPCSGLGVLRRRPDARWRVGAGDVERLASQQRQLVSAAAELVRPGGLLVYSVCTLTEAETLGVDGWLADRHGDLVAEPPPGDPWRPHGRGAWLLPQWADTDGMFVLRLRRGGHPGDTPAWAGPAVRR